MMSMFMTAVVILKVTMFMTAAVTMFTTATVAMFMTATVNMFTTATVTMMVILMIMMVVMVFTVFIFKRSYELGRYKRTRKRLFTLGKCWARRKDMQRCVVRRRTFSVVVRRRRTFSVVRRRRRRSFSVVRRRWRTFSVVRRRRRSFSVMMIVMINTHVIINFVVVAMHVTSHTKVLMLLVFMTTSHCNTCTDERSQDCEFDKNTATTILAWGRFSLYGHSSDESTFGITGFITNWDHFVFLG